MRYFALFILTASLLWATTYNSDGTSADVQTKINLCISGDTVTIPAGTFAWSSGVTISGKGITLSGAGGGRVEGSSSSTVAIGTGTKTFTIRSGSTITGFVAAETLTVRDKFIAGNTMTGTVTSWDGTTLVMNITSSAGSGPTNHWTFEAAALTNLTHNAGTGVLIAITKDAAVSTTVASLRLVAGTGTGYGIQISGTGPKTLIHDMRISSIHQGIRDNTNGILVWYFYADAGFNISTAYNNNDNAIQMTVASLTASWTNVNTVGTNDTGGLTNIYIEDSYFCGLVLGCVDLGDNFRGAMRHCVFDNSSVTLHGQDTDAYGCRQVEAYNNLFNFDSLPNPGLSANLNYWFTWRSGSGIVTDNTMDDITSWSWGAKNEIQLEYQPLGRTNTAQFGADGWPGGLDGTIVHYPGSHQPGQGSNALAAWFTSAGSPPIYTATNTFTEGVYVYTNTGTSVTVPIDYPPDIPGLSPPRSITDYIQLNRDYFTSAPGIGTPFYGYTKYTYPNPLRTGGNLNSVTNTGKLSGVLP